MFPTAWNASARACLRVITALDSGMDEPQIDPVQRWSQTRAPEDLLPAVDALEPRINYHLHQYGLGDDKLAKGQARIYAAKALQSFDPTQGAGFNTWLDRNMMQLSRFKRLRATPVRIPEKTQLDAMTLEKARTSFEEEFGREPELDELADAAGMTVARVDAVRQGFRKVAPEGAFDGNLAGAVTSDHLAEAIDIVWNESDKRDRRIIELKTGYGGKAAPMAPKDVAVALGISPVELSRRSARLAAKLEEIVENLDT